MLTACKSQLYTDLEERDANEMVALLASHAIGADKDPIDKGLFKVQVPRDDFERAYQLLREHGLPRSQFSTLGEVFKREGLVTSANSERLRLMYAMSQELSNTLSQIDGVLLARVHPVLPTSDTLSETALPASASVFIKHTANANIQMLAPAIRDMVSSSIEGLPYDRVSLTFVPSQAATSRQFDPVFVAAPSARPGPDTWPIVVGGSGLLLAGAGVGFSIYRRRSPAARPPAGRPVHATGRQHGDDDDGDGEAWPTMWMDDEAMQAAAVRRPAVAESPPARARSLPGSASRTSQRSWQNSILQQAGRWQAALSRLVRRSPAASRRGRS